MINKIYKKLKLMCTFLFALEQLWIDKGDILYTNMRSIHSEYHILTNDKSLFSVD